MSGFYGITERREVIRVKIKKHDGFMQPECKKFSLDPQITSFEMLQHIVASAFSIKGDFTLSYLARDDEGQEIYLSMLSDWDMDAAFQSASDPCLQIKVDLKPFDDGLDDWDIIGPVDFPQQRAHGYLDGSSLLGTLTSQVGKTVSRSMQKVMGFKGEEESKYKPSKSPVTDLEFRNYLDSSGHMVKPEELRLSIYQGGIEASLRRVVWRHLLNIFPAGLSGKERFDYMKTKENEYYKLRDHWKEHFKNGSLSEEIKHVATLVKKDVLRTDRTHKFYSGSDDNKNLITLFHVLVTYAVTHPEVSYCQGMSDVASPLLVIQKDEAQAYLCFCALMNRLRTNFLFNGNAIETKFQHLQDLIRIHDPVFYEYLKNVNASDMFFCYRWLLLECKREFPFDDSMYMLEVMWSTLPPSPPDLELALADPDYRPDFLSMPPTSPSFTSKQNIYAQLLARRIHIHSKVKDIPNGSQNCVVTSVNNNLSADDNSPLEDKMLSQDYPSVNDELMTKSIILKSSSIDNSLKETCPIQGYKSMDIERTYSTVETVTEEDEHNSRENIDNSVVGATSLNTENDKSSFCVDHAINEDFNLKRNNEFDEEDLKVEINNETEDCDEQNNSQDSHCEDDSAHGQSQFYISLESSEEREAPKPTTPPTKGSFFDNVKKRIMISPLKKQSDAVSKSSNSKTVADNRSNSVSSQGSGSENNHSKNDFSDSRQDDSGMNSALSSIEVITNDNLLELPPPEEFGSGNPFLMFICLTLLLQHRDVVIQNHLEYDEMAMLFDKMVRKHDVHKVLHQARILYADYLQSQQRKIQESV
ncbi:TBC1 domain family member 25 [Mytilus coruscus]|uniref:TBC1 domain family member 25 n=1 Tax=Mytilus coruscus TaxID=42192 RepID=A0A6J8DYZ4_MYTCO|nr:TBC1 domain family member 25 [Mytilus coruscus]